jgi:ribosomal-protein-alanine N-acetyltransferase
MSNAVLVPSPQMRPMQEADLPRVMEIEGAAYPFPWTLRLFKDCLQVGYNVQVLELEQKIMGYGLMSVAAGEAQILNLCVHPDWQGCGYGRYILEHLLDMARQKEVKSVFLEVRLSNEAAFHLYHQAGFNQIGERKRYYPNGDKGREDALILAMDFL